MLKNFVSKRVLYREDRVTMNPATQLKLINLNKETNLKSLNLIEVGTKEKRLLSASILGETVFRKNCLKFYISPATQLQMKLSFDNKVILHAQYLHPEKRKEAHSTSAISNLSFKIVLTLSSEAKKFFGSSYDTTVDDIVDKIRQEWKIYQVENIPSGYFQKDVNFSASSSTKQKSQDEYWEKALKECGIYHDSTECSNFHRIDHYWTCIGYILDSDGRSKCLYLFTFSTIVLSLSHANIVPEKGFSINKHLLSIHGNFINEETIAALRLIKNHLFKVGGPTKLKMTPKLLVSVKNSFQRYNADLEAKREYRERIEKEKAQRKAEIEESKQQGENLSQIENDIANTKDDFKSAEMILQNANEHLSKEMKKTKLYKEGIMKSQSVIQMSIDRKRILGISLNELKKKKGELLSKKKRL